MTCNGGFSLDEATRRTWYNPEEILEEAGVKEGSVFVDVGSGEGFFTMLASKVVGRSGAVYAVDTDSEAIKRLKAKATQEHLTNIKTRVNPAEKTVFCNRCADFVFYSMVLHDFKDPVKVLTNAKEMLKPSGKLIDLDWKKQQMQFGPPFNIRFSDQDATGLIKMSGFHILKVREAGPYHYLITAEHSGRC